LLDIFGGPIRFHPEMFEAAPLGAHQGSPKFLVGELEVIVRCIALHINRRLINDGNLGTPLRDSEGVPRIDAPRRFGHEATGQDGITRCSREPNDASRSRVPRPPRSIRSDDDDASGAETAQHFAQGAGPGST
jgi:hypothetical protein